MALTIQYNHIAIVKKGRAGSKIKLHLDNDDAIMIDNSEFGDNPMAKIKLAATTSLLSIDRAITPTERRRLLDSADLLRETGGRSKDRHRHRDTSKRPQLKVWYQPPSLRLRDWRRTRSHDGAADRAKMAGSVTTKN